MVRMICILLFIYEVSMVLQTGIRIMLPGFAYTGEGEYGIYKELTREQADYFFPVYGYEKENLIVESRKDVFRIKVMEESQILTLMDLENSGLGIVAELGPEMIEEPILETDSSRNEKEGEVTPETTEQNEEESFVKHEKTAPLDLSELADYETLVKKFYTIDAITAIGADELNAEKLGRMDMTLKQTSDAPQILIYHTHSQEGFADSVPGDDSTTILGVGEYLAQVLEEEYGYHVIHHTGKYDVKTRDNAYSRSLPEIQKLLEENPTIEVVIDLHRDAVADENTRLVTELDGRPTAKFMFFNGISRTRSTGKIDYLYNENLEMNLAFSFQMKWKAEEYYPGLTRRNYLNAYRYNMHLCPKTLLIELGAQNNTLEEAMNACAS